MENLIGKIQGRSAVVGVAGLGYVGLPLVQSFIKAGFQVFGFDTDNEKVERLKSGKSYIKHITDESILEMMSSERFCPTTDFTRMSEPDAILICVPTPLNGYREPDMSFVMNTTRAVTKTLRAGQLISLESTTYPGTTSEEMLAVLEQSGLKAGKDFFLAYSPEREDPNNGHFCTSTIPKVVGGHTCRCLKVADALYSSIIDKTVPVSSTQVAEATKLVENIFRSVNIALVNELKLLFDRMDIDIWEVVSAASTKPFGFMPFYPGPGLGGHCIPIDPFYLTWKARKYDFHTRFIELAGEIINYMPYHVIDKVGEALNRMGKPIKGSRVLVLGVAYKRNVDDMRESPALKIIEMLMERNAKVDYSDPYVPNIPKLRKYRFDMSSVPLTAKNIQKYDCTLVITDHTDFNYELVYEHSKSIVDTRNALSAVKDTQKKVYKA
ncbi:MAG TPA: nucleotide sugar dehydrogenase [Nitrospirota bacterium]|jgi:UDP-N-acetyl-D-glucosamine dehydrogenase